MFFSLKNILVLLAKLDSGELCCPAAALINNCDFDAPNFKDVEGAYIGLGLSVRACVHRLLLCRFKNG